MRAPKLYDTVNNSCNLWYILNNRSRGVTFSLRLVYLIFNLLLILAHSVSTTISMVVGSLLLPLNNNSGFTFIWSLVFGWRLCYYITQTNLNAGHPASLHLFIDMQYWYAHLTVWVITIGLIFLAVLYWSIEPISWRTPNDEIFYTGPIRNDYLPHCPEFLQGNLIVLDFYRLGPLDLPWIAFWFVFDWIRLVLGLVYFSAWLLLVCLLAVDFMFFYTYTMCSLLLPQYITWYYNLLLFLNDLSDSEYFEVDDWISAAGVLFPIS